MSYNENRQNSQPEGLRIPGLVESQDHVEQLAFTSSATAPLSANSSSQFERESWPGLTQNNAASEISSTAVGLADPETPSPSYSDSPTRELLLRSQPAVTRALTDMLSTSTTSALRPTVVIRGNGSGTRVRGGHRPPQGRRHIISIAAVLLLLFITGGTLFAVSPLGHESGILSPLAAGSNLIRGGNPTNLNLMTQQATATAISHQQNDGFEPGAVSSGAIVTGSPEVWPYGVCTYWANLRYHELTGVWVTWIGDAYQWVDGAQQAGWHVSSEPHVPSIIVLEPGVQGASGLGHVAVVESASGNTVHTSNMNWFADGGGYGIVSYFDFTTGPGVYFIWA